MWERLRSATGAPGGGEGQGRSNIGSVRRTTRSSTAPLAAGWRSDSAPSWQPRSSVLAAARRLEGQEEQQAYAARAGRPPPRPPRPGEFETPSSLEPFPPPPPLPRSNTAPVTTQYSTRPPSSIYSQPSPLVTDFPRFGAGGGGGARASARASTAASHAFRYSAAAPLSPYEEEEVSPPSSPEDELDMVLPNHDISPIDEQEDDIPLPPTRHARPLPEPPTMMTSHALLPSQQRREAAAAAAATRTTSPPSAAAATTPASNLPMKRREQRQAQRSRESSNNIIGPRGLGISTMSSAGPPSPERSRRVPPLLSPRAARPGWKGASGRLAIVDPVRDDTAVAPLRVPARSGLRAPTTPDGERSGGGGRRDNNNNNLRVGVGGAGIAGLNSPPLSPETSGGIGGGGGMGGGSANAPASIAIPSRTVTITGGSGNTGNANSSASGPVSAGRSLANTLRNLIPTTNYNLTSTNTNKRNSPTSAPTSDGANVFWNTSSKNNKTKIINLDTSLTNTSSTRAAGVDGYPSPPLSGSGTYTVSIVGGVGRSSPPVVGFNAHESTEPSTKVINALSAGAAAAAAGLGNSQTRHPSDSSSSQPPLQLHQRLSNSTLRTLQQPVKRKEVGAASRSASTTSLLNPTTNDTTDKRRTYASFSSSVYSHLDFPDDSYNTTTDKNTPQSLTSKNLPSLPTGLTPDDPYNQPPSRFSVTTYATSAHTTRSSPRNSYDADAPPLPTPPKDFVLTPFTIPNTNNTTANTNTDMAAAKDAGVLARSRPQMRGGSNKWEDPAPADEEPVKISLSKAWMSTAGANSSGTNVQNSPPPAPKPATRNAPNKPIFGFGFLSASKSPTTTTVTALAPPAPAPAAAAVPADPKASSRPASMTSNMDKDLPAAPSSITTSSTNHASGTAPTTTDRITNLNASLQDLANRRMNINRAIRQMTELMPQDNLILHDAVRKKREDEKRKIEELRGKLDDIGREEHDLGMKLHRAYKKLDQTTEYEPTTLWVRRATGS